MDNLIPTTTVADMLGTSPRIATTILLQNGLQPVNLGRGRGRGNRWLASAVQAVIQDLHDKAQKAPRSSAKPPRLTSRVASMPIGDLYALTRAKRMQ